MARKRERLIFAPLGGAGEIGMNAYVYGWGLPGKERLIVVDLGVTFPSMDGTPGVDLIMPDVSWLMAQTDRIEAVFITHGHEDHVGALGHLYHRLGAPRVITRRFTAEVARGKLEGAGLGPEVVEVVKPWPERVQAGPFEVSFMPVAHSIPEASGLVIDTPAGRVVHTGDFKLDPDPGVGEPYDPQTWREIAGEGIQALVCDSTNVFTDHPGRSETTIAPNIHALVEEAKGLFVATTFASNVARLKTLAEAGRMAGRSVAVLGRAMQRMMEYARSTGVLDDFPPLVSAEEALEIPRENLMLIVTGSQGERRAASAQLASGKYLGFEMREGDTFLFSSKTIPGNEIAVGRIMNAFSAMGVRVIDDEEGRNHVSGHANRPDLEKVHRLFRPRMVIPMHGEHRHLREHAELARFGGFASAIVPNGTVAEIGGSEPALVEEIPAGRTYLDGTQLIGAYDGVVLERIRMATRGMVAVSILIEDGQLLGEPWAEPVGLPEASVSGPGLQERIEKAIHDALKGQSRKVLEDDDKVEELARRAVRKAAQDHAGKKPVVRVMINRLES